MSDQVSLEGAHARLDELEQEHEELSERQDGTDRGVVRLSEQVQQLDTRANRIERMVRRLLEHHGVDFDG